MKRDLDLIREIILRLEAAKDPIAITKDTCETEWGVPYPVMLFHLELLDEVGYVYMETSQIFAPRSAPHTRDHEKAKWMGTITLQRLTWKGCDYAAVIEDNTRWAELKSAIAKKWADIAVAGTLAIVDAGPSIINRIARMIRD